MNYRNYLYVLFLLCIPVWAVSQHQSECKLVLSGKITDKQTGEALCFAEMLLTETNQTATTNEKGFYTLEHICPGTYSVKVFHLGCHDTIFKITVSGTQHFDVALEHRAHELNEVTVHDKLVDQKSTQTKNTIQDEELTKRMGGTLGDVLKGITGVTSLQTGNNISKPVIHGLHSNRVLVLNNGVRQEGQQWGNEHAPEIDPFIAKRVSVVKGANAVRYGADAIAGVILVEPSPLRDSAGLGMEVNVAAFDNNRMGVVSAISEGNFARLKPFSWRLQGTLKKGGNVKTPDYYQKNTGVEEYNFSYAMGWSKVRYGAEIFYSQFNTTLGIFSGAHIGNVTDLMNAFNRGTPADTAGFTYEIERPYQHIEHELFKTKAYVVTGDKGNLSLTYARQYNIRYEFDKHRPLNDSLAGLNNPELKFQLTSHTADLIWEHKRIASLVGSIGVSGITQGNTYNGRFFIPNFRNYAGGIFIIERWKKNKFELEGGVRYDQKFLQVFMFKNDSLIKPSHSWGNVSGNVGAIYRLNTHWSFNVNSGTAWRSPNVNELYSNGIHHGTATFEIGNELLRPEYSFNTVVTTNVQGYEHVNAEVSFYHNQIQDFIYVKPVFPAIVTIRGAFPAYEFSQANVYMNGLDAAVQVNFTHHFSYVGKGSIVRSRNKKNNEFLVMMPSDRMENTLRYELHDKKHHHHTFFAITVMSVAKQWRVPANSDYIQPPSGYNLLSAEFGTALHVKKQQVDVFLSINNLLNAKYRDYLDRFRYYTDAMGRNISLKIKIPLEIKFKPIKK